MKPSLMLMGLLGLLPAAVAHAALPPPPPSVVVTASNTAANQLLVYSPTGALLRTLPTGGQGGVSGNAGGGQQAE